jgi:hypothetical protein
VLLLLLFVVCYAVLGLQLRRMVDTPFAIGEEFAYVRHIRKIVR